MWILRPGLPFAVTSCGEDLPLGQTDNRKHGNDRWVLVGSLALAPIVNGHSQFGSSGDGPGKRDLWLTVRGHNKGLGGHSSQS